MNTIIPIITQEIVHTCISSLSCTVISSYNLYNYIIKNTPSDYQNYQKEITATDLSNKLTIISCLIKDIIKKYPSNDNIDFPLDEEFNIIIHIKNNNIVSDLPEPVKIALSSTLEIIENINNILEQIHNKIKYYTNSFSKYFSKLNIKNEVDKLIILDNIFEKRITILLEVVKIYKII
jgi:hypothetical protein